MPDGKEQKMIITDEKRTQDLANNVVGRTHEVYQYDLNISNYQTILAASDGVYPEHLLALKDLPADQAVAQCPIEDLAELVGFIGLAALGHDFVQAFEDPAVEQGEFGLDGTSALLITIEIS